MITKDGRNTPLENLTPENYIVPKGEERVYHALIEVKQFDSKTGRRISKPRVQKFGAKIFEQIVRDALRKQGYDVVILHNPKDYLAKEAETKAESAKAAREAKAKAEQERFDAAVKAAAEAAAAKIVDAAVAKALAAKDAADKKADGAGKKSSKKKEENNA